MKVAVIGSRSISNADISRFIPPDAELIISGGAIGVDTLAEKYADAKGIKKMILYPDYELYMRRTLCFPAWEIAIIARKAENK